MVWYDDAKQDALEPGEYLSKVVQKICSFGLIREFIGRLPIISSLLLLDTDVLVEILTKPKNALVKQYQKLSRA